MAPVQTDMSEIVAPGRIVAGYRIERELGRGAMAIVCRAIQLNLERPVALKVLTTELAENEEFVARFFNEARAAAQLSHPSIVQAYDAGVTEGNIHYFAMEYVEGETLLNRILREGFLRPSVGLWVALDMADALDYGWQTQRLTHGDIKPENIMLNKSGQTKLADFGLAKVQGHDFEGSEIMLTPLYAAPELIRGQRLSGDCRADIYSFGATMYHMFAGVPPFPGEEAREVMRRHVTEPLTPLSQRNPAISKNISDFVASLLEKSPEDRPQDWQEIKRKLRLLEQGLKVLKKLKHLKGGGHDGRRAIRSTRGSVSGGHTTRHVRARNKRNRQPIVALSSVAVLLSVLLVVLLYLITATGQTRPGEPVVTEAGGEGAVAAEARTGAEQEWRELSAVLARTRDPEDCIRLLEDFGRKYAHVAPAEYHDRLEQYREALKWRRAAERAQNKHNSVAGDGAAAEDRKREQREPLSTESERQRGNKAETVVANTRPRGAAEADREAGAARRHEARVPIDMRKDAYTDFVAALSRYEYVPGRSLDPLLSAGRSWLERFTDATAERQRVRFFVETFVPKLEEFIPQLVTRKAKLVGKGLGTQKFAQDSIKDVTLGELVLSRRTEHGELIRKAPWTELDDPRYFVYLGQMAFADAASDIDACAPYLAFLLISGSFKQWDATLRGFPDDGNKRPWMELKIDLESGRAEGNALALWRKSKQMHEQGEWSRAHRLLQELRSTRTAIAFRYRDEIAELERACADAVPDTLAAAMVREAQKVMAEDPAAALATLNKVVAYYGRTDFPEKTEIETLRDRALDRLPKDKWVENMLARPIRLFAPFVVYPRPSMPALSMVMYREAVREGMLSETDRASLPVLHGLARLEMGDWAGARKPLLDGSPVELSDASPALRASLLFGRGLIAHRFETRMVGPGEILAELKITLDELDEDSSWLSASIASLMIEYAILTRRYSVSTADVVRWPQAMSRRSARQAKKRFVLNALAWMIESARTDEAAAVLGRICSDAALFEECDFTDEDRPFLQGLRGHVTAGSGLRPPPRLGDRQLYGEQYLRVVLAALLQRPLTEQVANEWQLIDVQEFHGSASPIASMACFDLLMWHVARHLALGDVAAGIEAADHAIRLEGPVVAPFFPRVCFLKAGLLALNGQLGRGRETLEMVRSCTVANETELLVAQCLADDVDPSPIRAKLQENRDFRFWYLWLLATREFVKNESGDAERFLGRLAEQSVSNNEKRLAQALEMYVTRMRK